MNARVDLSTLADAIAAKEAEKRLEAEARASRPREEVAIEEGKPASAWLVVVTKGNREKSTAASLRAEGFECYVPFRLLDAVQAKRRGVDAVPLFPRILFARATLDAERWQVIFNTPGVVRVLCDPHKPKGVSDVFVQRIRSREIRGFLKLGLVDPNRPTEATKRQKDPRKWVKLDDVVDGLLGVSVDEARKSVLVSLLIEGRASITQAITRK